MTIKEALKHSFDILSGITDEAENESRLLVAHLADEEPNKLYFSNREIDRAELDKLLQKRRENTPIQYLLGKWWFYKGEFFVGDGVLIPRQDTETLVETANKLLKGIKAPTVADLCAGSGCIGISIGCDNPNANVVCVEKYEKAFSFLEKNIQHNKAENVKAIKADVLESAFGKYDIIVSNPPYITAEDMKTLSDEVKKEPETALYGGEDGLDFYRAISDKWKSALKENGILAFEVGYGEAEAVSEILLAHGYKNITVKKDLNGIQRVVFGTVDNI